MSVVFFRYYLVRNTQHCFLHHYVCIIYLFTSVVQVEGKVLTLPGEGVVMVVSVQKQVLPS